MTWALIRPSVWALAAGPLVGGLFKTVASHRILPGPRLRLGWDPEHVRALFSFGKWVIGGTLVSFVAQQFHVLYLGKFLPLAILGVYQVAWNFCVQASKPLTMLSNRVIIPHFAQFARSGSEEHARAVEASLSRFLPACLLVCTGAGLVCPALFGFFYERSFEAGGDMGRLLALVVWFMVLQHVPRSALLSMGISRSVAAMALSNAIFTVGGIVAGFAITRGSVPGAIVGNALGNVAGCVAGAWLSGRAGLRVAGPMARATLLFLALMGAGALAEERLGEGGALGAAWASLAVTVVVCLPLAILVWQRTGREVLRARRQPA